jgi:hypothetical protein
MLLNPLKFVNSSNGMKIIGQNVDCVEYGVSRCMEYEYVYRCGSLEKTSNIVSICLKVKETSK